MKSYITFKNDLMSIFYLFTCYHLVVFLEVNRLAQVKHKSGQIKEPIFLPFPPLMFKIFLLGGLKSLFVWTFSGIKSWWVPILGYI